MERKTGLIEHINGSQLSKRIDKDSSPHLIVTLANFNDGIK